MTNRRRFRPIQPGREETDQYDRVVLRWDYSADRATRIVAFRDHWVIQHRTMTNGPEWRSIHLCPTRADLVRLLPAKTEEILSALPEEALSDGQ